jgi:pimeloyl-ACP methyl ester carboxylesterase
VAVDKPDLVLLHGLTASAAGWRDVVPLVSQNFTVHAPTAIGHRGGPPALRRPITADDVIDWAVEYLDAQGLSRPYVAGHSMGGFVAIELARRGRATAACALAPGGFWSDGDGLRAQTVAKVQGGSGFTRLIRPVLPLMLRVAPIRRAFMQYGACHAERVTAKRAIEIIDDFIGCSVADQVFSTDDQRIAPLDPLPCPVTIAWSEKDVIIPFDRYQPNAQKCLPEATFEILPDVGHDPMMDDPRLVAATILKALKVDHGQQT